MAAILVSPYFALHPCGAGHRSAHERSPNPRNPPSGAWPPCRWISLTIRRCRTRSKTNAHPSAPSSSHRSRSPLRPERRNPHTRRERRERKDRCRLAHCPPGRDWSTLNGNTVAPSVSQSHTFKCRSRLTKDPNVERQKPLPFLGAAPLLALTCPPNFEGASRGVFNCAVFFVELVGPSICQCLLGLSLGAVFSRGVLSLFDLGTPPRFVLGCRTLRFQGCGFPPWKSLALRSA